MGSTDTLAAEVVRRVRKVVGTGDKQLHKPFIDLKDAGFVHRVAAGDPVGYGAINEFEAELAQLCQRKFCIAVSSGTAALHLALVAAGVGPGAVVSMPTLNFIAAANAVRYCGAAPYLGKHRHATRVGVHLLGTPSPDICAPDEPHSILIEDAAEALGSRWDGKPCGSFGDVSILSFNINKIVTTGGGGAVLTDSPSLAEKVRHLATTAKLPSLHFYVHDKVGFNYRLGNLAAALGLSQLPRLPNVLRFKAALHEAYQEAFAGMVEVVPLGDGAVLAKPNYWLNALLVPPAARDAVLQALTVEGLGCRALFTPLHLQGPYAHFARSREEAELAERQFDETVLLPSGRL